jgi:hypothetical protein
MRAFAPDTEQESSIIFTHMSESELRATSVEVVPKTPNNSTAIQLMNIFFNREAFAHNRLNQVTLEFSIAAMISDCFITISERIVEKALEGSVD